MNCVTPFPRTVESGANFRYGLSMSRAHGKLNEKEHEILSLLLQGYSVKTAARMLDVSANTLNERLRSARRKLGVASSREAALLLRDDPAHSHKSPVTNEFGMGFSSSPRAVSALPVSTGAEGQEAELATVQAAYMPLASVWIPGSGLPLRQKEMRDNELGRSGRLRAFRETTLALATSFALICLAFILISTLLRQR